MPVPWDPTVWETEGDDWEFDSAAADAPGELYSLWDTAVARSRAAVAEIAERGGLSCRPPRSRSGTAARSMFVGW